jgi:hypothetical protein
MIHAKRFALLKQLKPKNYTTHIKWKGTCGAGDFMYGLNIAHWRSFILQKPVTIEYHWYHNESYLHHYEDPETIYDRLNYLNNLYFKMGTEVNVTHVWNSENYLLWSERFQNYDRNIDKRKYMKSWAKFRHNDWLFRPEILRAQVIPNKLVLFRPTFNAEQPRDFKLPYTDSQWLEVIDMIKHVHGFNVVEIDYRTPIREVVYHIKTCRATISYEGMWHYVAKNMHKPMIVLSSDPITKTHTPDALIYNPRLNKGFDPAKGHKPIYKVEYFYDLEKRIKLAEKFSKNRTMYLRDLFNEYRQSSN